MPSVGPWELLILLVIVIVIFGAGKLVSIGTALGSSIRDFRHAMRDDDDDVPSRM